MSVVCFATLNLNSASVSLPLLMAEVRILAGRGQNRGEGLGGGSESGRPSRSGVTWCPGASGPVLCLPSAALVLLYPASHGAQEHLLKHQSGPRVVG